MRQFRSLIPVLAVTLLGVTGERAAAELRCTPAVVDLGEIPGGTPREQRFTLRNDGARPIEIIEVERGCGCLSTQLERRVVPPGADTVLFVELRTSGQPNGLRSWNLRVRYRDGEQIRETLVILGGTIRNEVIVEPSILALHVRSTLRQEIVITDRRSRPLKVTNLHIASPVVHAAITSAKPGRTTITLEATAAALTSDREELVLNIYTDAPGYSPLQVPITLTRPARAAVQAVPAQVVATVSAAQPVAAALVRLRRTDGKPAVVTSAAGDDPGLTCTWAVGPGSAATLKVQVDVRRLAERDGPRSVHVRLGDETLTLPVVVERGRSARRAPTRRLQFGGKPPMIGISVPAVPLRQPTARGLPTITKGTLS